MIQTVHHIQLAIPHNGEERARAFYGTLLGLREIPKPEPLAQRGGCWFETGGARLHLGVDARFLPAKKAHLAFQVDDLDELKKRLEEYEGPLELDLSWPGMRRFYCHDPFGNRLEFLAPLL